MLIIDITQLYTHTTSGLYNDSALRRVNSDPQKLKNMLLTNINSPLWLHGELTDKPTGLALNPIQH